MSQESRSQDRKIKKFFYINKITYICSYGNTRTLQVGQRERRRKSLPTLFDEEIQGYGNHITIWL